MRISKLTQKLTQSKIRKRISKIIVKRRINPPSNKDYASPKLFKRRINNPFLMATKIRYTHFQHF